MWDRLLEVLIDTPDYEWLMINASHCKVHPHAEGALRGQSGHGPHKRGLNTKIHLAVDAHGMPHSVLVTEGTRADCTQASRLMEGIDADQLVADKG